MTTFSQWVTPLSQNRRESLPEGGAIEYEDLPVSIDVTGPLLYRLFKEQWQQTQIGHVVEGSVLELEFTSPPKICVLYDGYLTVVTEAWHLHLCLEEHRGGPLGKTPPQLRQQRLLTRASLYRRFNAQGQARSWGIQFWNGANEKMMNIFLPNPYVGQDEDLLPEHKPQLEKLGLYEELRQIYILGESPIPYQTNPLKRPYLAVCRSGRCYPSREWQPVFDALRQGVEQADLEVDVITSGCLEVCRSGPVVFYSGDSTWYVRVNPNVAQQIVQSHLVEQKKLSQHLYPACSNLSNSTTPDWSETLNTP